ncbi:hypothetical protein HK097_002420 [Rhizophlyctis rosea]|uniref:Uncharacterized protein n=1 Tax=Rhizophlyctis rosea TaxID=64517 RepID=A0AAD5X387_9FUNG|nr:hypothetical protein HK097_002420 [Rhizophlyctis rosea]
MVGKAMRPSQSVLRVDTNLNQSTDSLPTNSAPVEAPAQLRLTEQPHVIDNEVRALRRCATVPDLHAVAVALADIDTIPSTAPILERSLHQSRKMSTITLSSHTSIPSLTRKASINRTKKLSRGGSLTSWRRRRSSVPDSAVALSSVAASLREMDGSESQHSRPTSFQSLIQNPSLARSATSSLHPPSVAASSITSPSGMSTTTLEDQLVCMSLLQRTNSVSSSVRTPSNPTILLNGLAEEEPDELLDDDATPTLSSINLAETIKVHTTTTLLNVTEETIHTTTQLDPRTDTIYPSMCRSVRSVVIHQETVTTVEAKRTPSYSRRRFSIGSTSSEEQTDSPATSSFPLPRRSRSFDDSSTVRHLPTQSSPALHQLHHHQSTASFSTFNTTASDTPYPAVKDEKKRHPVVKAMRKIHKSASIVGLWAAARVGLNQKEKQQKGGVYGQRSNLNNSTDSIGIFASSNESLNKSLHVKWQSGTRDTKPTFEDVSRRTSMVVKEKIALPAEGGDVSASYRLVLAAVGSEFNEEKVFGSRHGRSDSNASQATVVCPPSVTNLPPTTPPHYTPSQKEWASLLWNSSPPSPASVSDKPKFDYFDADNTGAHLVSREVSAGGNDGKNVPPAGKGWKVVWRRLGVDGA